MAASSAPPGVSPFEPAPIAGPLRNAGRWLVDAEGRVVVLHGFNLVGKVPPYLPQAAGFGRDDAAFLESQGFNVLRLGVVYDGLMPAPGHVDGAYLRRLHQLTSMLSRYHVLSLLDVHQDAFSPVFGGEGFPAWMVNAPALFHGNTGIEPATDTMDPGLLYAWSNFLDNTPRDGMRPLDAFDQGLTALAQSFTGDPSIAGYNLLNEPWAGTDWLLCARPGGCPDFDRQKLTPFTNRAIAAVRRGDPGHLAWYEPVFFFSYGAQTSLGAVSDAHTGFSFHVYCPASDVFAGLTVTPCSGQEEGILDRAEAVAAAHGSTLMNTEWGASTDYVSIARLADEMDEHMVSWAFWAYYDCCGGPDGDRGIIVDPRRPPDPGNLVEPKLDAVGRPYPQATAGTPLWYRFDAPSRTFTFAYSTAAPPGVLAAPSALTQVFAGSRFYPRGYRVEVSGAEVVSQPCAPFIALRNQAGADRVELRVVPGECGQARLASALHAPVAPDRRLVRLAVIALGWLAAAVAVYVTAMVGRAVR